VLLTDGKCGGDGEFEYKRFVFVETTTHVLETSLSAHLFMLATDFMGDIVVSAALALAALEHGIRRI